MGNAKVIAVANHSCCESAQGAPASNRNALSEMKEKVAYQMMKVVIHTLLFLSYLLADAGVYYVRTDGSNTNSGLQADAQNAWRTIDYAVDSASAGDTVYVNSGEYDERVTCQVSGTASSYINIVGVGLTKPVFRNLQINGSSYVRWVNFEITHTDLRFMHGVVLGEPVGGFLEFHDLYIHHVQGTFIRTLYGYKDCLIRGCKALYSNKVPQDGSVINGDPVQGFQIGGIGADRWLVEYNEIRRCADFLNCQGSDYIARNNVIGEFRFQYWNTISADPHVDYFQTYSTVGAQRHLYESNYMYDNLEEHSHVFQLKTDGVNQKRAFVVRGNAINQVGSYLGEFDGLDDSSCYNNTFVKAEFGFGYGSEGAQVANNWNNFNNIYVQVNEGGQSLLAFDSDVGCVLANNWYFESALGQGGGIGFSDPKLSNVVGHSLWVEPDSPVRGQGRRVASIASSSGAGTMFSVATGEGHALIGERRPFVEGDVISVGGSVTRVVSVDGDAITVSGDLSWSQGDPIYWGREQSPDVGAYPSWMQDYSISGVLTNAGNQFTVSVSNRECCRMVVFYENGIPQDPDFDFPYQYSSGGGEVSAKIYNRYANRIPVVNAVASLWTGDLLAGEIVMNVDQGTVEKPFFINADNSILQDIYTSKSLFGERAVYEFVVVHPGDYGVKARVSCPDGGSNSFFTNIDAEPATEHFWNIPETSAGFETREASWLGESAPKTWYLTLGTH